MDRLFSALVLGIYLASCAPALPPAGSAADGRGIEHALSAGRAAGELPDAAREKRLVEAWQRKIMRQDDEIKRALKELIPEIRDLYDELYPAPGFDPKSVWGNAAPHTYVYQVSRGNVKITEGEYKGQSFYDVRQVGFLFSKVEELERTETAYISKAALLRPFFEECFGEAATQRAAGNTDPDLAAYPLVKQILDRGLKLADYVDFSAYYDLYMWEWLGSPIGVDPVTYAALAQYYRDKIIENHREYLKQCELYATNTESLLEPGETRLDREYIAGQGINFASAEFTARLNSFSLRKNAFENIGDILDGYWEALKGVPMFRRMFERAVENLAAYLAAKGVVADAECLPTYFKCRYTIPVYRCRAPYLAVCGAAQALAFGWVQAPAFAVRLEGDKSYIDVPRISSADSNKLGISYASFETGRGNGQDGFSGYGTPDTHGGHVLNGKPGEWRPDKFSMGAFSGSAPFSYGTMSGWVIGPNFYPYNEFAQAYLQCNFPYKMFSKAALKGMPEDEAAEVVLRQTCGSIPRYWQDRFHYDADDRDTVNKILLIIDILLLIVTIGTAVYQTYDLYMFYQALEAFETVPAEAPLEAKFVADMLARNGTRAAWANSSSGYGYVIYAGEAASFPAELIGTTNQYGWYYALCADESLGGGDYIFLIPGIFKTPPNLVDFYPYMVLGNATAEGYVGGIPFTIIMKIMYTPPMIVTQETIFMRAMLAFIIRVSVLTPGWVGLQASIKASNQKNFPKGSPR